MTLSLPRATARTKGGKRDRGNSPRFDGTGRKNRTDLTTETTTIKHNQGCGTPVARLTPRIHIYERRPPKSSAGGSDQGGRGEGAVAYPVLAAARLGGDRHGWSLEERRGGGGSLCREGERRGEVWNCGAIWDWGFKVWAENATVESLARLAQSPHWYWMGRMPVPLTCREARRLESAASASPSPALRLDWIGLPG